ncbi:hypothetical protein ACFSRY_09910 [Pontibacter locisalis]|uniref:Uncharacterized protein n=1 Tax=Pontibacter locisalis TaxID=1719035 RepID=A0ABW5IKN0_9BACT
MEAFEFELTAADLELGPAATEAGRSSGLLWLLLLVGVFVLGVALYLALAPGPPPRKKSETEQ